MEKQDIYTIKNELEEIQGNDPYTFQTELKWLESKNAVKIYPDGNYSVIYENYKNEKNKLDEYIKWAGKRDYAIKMNNL